MLRNLDDEGWLLSLSWLKNSIGLEDKCNFIETLVESLEQQKVMVFPKNVNELNSVNPRSWISSPTKRRISRVVGVEHCYTNAFLCKPTGQRHSTEKNTTAAKFIQKITPSKNWLLRLLDLKHRSMRSWKIIMLLNAFCISNSFRRKHLVFSAMPKKDKEKTTQPTNTTMYDICSTHTPRSHRTNRRAFLTKSL